MEAWPIEEAYGVRPVGSLLLVALLPFLTRAVLSALVEDAATLARARAPVRATQLGLAFVIGGTALGPALAEAPGGLASHGAAFLAVALAGVVDQRISGPGDLRGIVGGVGAALLACGILGAFSVPYGIAVGAVLVTAGGGFAYRPRRRAADTTTAFGWFLGGAVALLLVAALAAPVPLTEIAPEDAPYHGDATWRLRVDPWDATAMLANGWAARERQELSRAVACARESVRMGGPRGPALELEAEVLAARGACDEARATFDRAIQARARVSFSDDSLLAPLVLGGYQLPPTLVTNCGGLEDLPRLRVPGGPITPP
ncbi:MAG: hypothetical protein KC619_22365 [Myxococcales bacterium]|nr:hypothetical protein [Myxococcales bacterium]